MEPVGRSRWLTTIRSRNADLIMLAVAGSITTASYTPRLGFYSDDWAFLARYVLSPDQSIAGLFNASYSAHHAMRPVQLWLGAALYSLFGLNPLGSHLFNASLIIVNPLLVYAIARELGVTRLIGFSIALVYLALPSYSTDRFWFVAFAITLSMTTCLISIFAALKWVTREGWRQVAWGTLSIAAAIVSGLSYEVALPVLAAVPLLMAWHSRKRFASAPLWRSATAAALMLVVVVSVAAFKAQTTVRLGATSGLGAQMLDIVRHAVRTDVRAGAYGLNIGEALRVHAGENALWLAPRAMVVLREMPWSEKVLSGVLVVGVFVYALALARRQDWPRLRQWFLTILGGLTVFSLGYAIFLTNYNVQFTAAGIANRSAIVAALGAAMIVVGVAGVISSAAVRAAAYVFASIVAVCVTCGVVMTHAIAAYWIAAYAEEQRIVSAIERQLPRPPQGATLLLDGVCPYLGPAIVFESNWDLAGALQIRYRDPTIKADVVTPRLAVEDRGVTTSIYGQTTVYPYSTTLLVVSDGPGMVYGLPDASSARRYFGMNREDPGCPPGQEGIGVAGS